MAQQFICTTCGTVGNPKKIIKGNILLEVFLWLFFIVPGIIYSIWRSATKYDGCSVCKSKLIIPVSSPAGQKLLAEQNA